jgi:branched-chain amino acid aminotransferase
MSEKVFLNDKIVEAGKGCIGVSDSGFLYGMGLFETMRSYNGAVFRMSDHLDRMAESGKALGIFVPEKDFVERAVYQTLEANELSDARIRVTVSNGPMSGQERKPTVLVSAAEFAAYPAEYYKNGVLTVISDYRQNPFDPTCGHKTTSYFARMEAIRTAHQKKAAEALWFTPAGKLAEGCVSNVFMAKGGVLYTPPKETPVLEGIARKTVLEIAEENSIELEQKELSLEDCLAADEIFLTNVIMQVMPVIGIEKHTVGEGKVGSVTKSLMEKFREVVEKSSE